MFEKLISWSQITVTQHMHRCTRISNKVHLCFLLTARVAAGCTERAFLGFGSMMGLFLRTWRRLDFDVSSSCLDDSLSSLTDEGPSIPVCGGFFHCMDQHEVGDVTIFLSFFLTWSRSGRFTIYFLVVRMLYCTGNRILAGGGQKPCSGDGRCTCHRICKLRWSVIHAFKWMPACARVTFLASFFTVINACWFSLFSRCTCTIWHLQRIQTLLLFFPLHLLHFVFSEMGSVKKIDFASSQFRLFVGSRSKLHGSLCSQITFCCPMCATSDDFLLFVLNFVNTLRFPFGGCSRWSCILHSASGFF